MGVFQQTFHDASQSIFEELSGLKLASVIAFDAVGEVFDHPDQVELGIEVYSRCPIWAGSWRIFGMTPVWRMCERCAATGRRSEPIAVGERCWREDEAGTEIRFRPHSGTRAAGGTGKRTGDVVRLCVQAKRRAMDCVQNDAVGGVVSYGCRVCVEVRREK